MIHALHVDALLANAGAPMTRRHAERLECSILGPRDPFIKVPLVLRAGIYFGIGVKPRDFMAMLLGEAGCLDAEELRDLFDHPPRRLMARPAPEHFMPKDVRHEKPDVILREALVLGLATNTIYDPNRPVLWTESSLTRRLELYDPQDFYQ